MLKINSQVPRFVKRYLSKGRIFFIMGILFPLQACLANPLFFPHEAWFGLQPVFNTELNLWTALTVVAVDCAIDFVVILGAYLLIKKLQLIKSRKFLGYFLLVVLGGFLVDEIVVYLIMPVIREQYEYSISYHFLIFPVLPFITAFALLLLYNYKLPKRFFNFTKRQAALVGFSMAILTNPLLYATPRSMVLERHYTKEKEYVIGKFFPLLMDFEYRQEIFDHFEQNPLLNKEEKVFVLRFWEFMQSDLVKEDIAEELAEPEKLVIDPYFLNSDLYKKWGLGKKSNFSALGKVYVSHIEEMNETWTEYQTIEVSEEEKKFLEEMHSKYGDGPINIVEIVKKEFKSDPNDELSKDDVIVLEYIEVLTGSDELDDRALIMLNRIYAALAGAYLMQMGQ